MQAAHSLESNTRTIAGVISGPSIVEDGDTRPVDVPVRRRHGLTGRVISRKAIRLDGRHAQGGAGMIYRATECGTGRALAIKVPRSDRGTAAESVLREAEILRTVESPNVVRFGGQGTLKDGRPWMAMEYLDGQSVAMVLASCGKVHPLRVVRWLRQACEGIAAIHASGWVHRDIKPSNLMVTGIGAAEQIKVVDLGIAERIGVRSATLCGTPDYIAPEQARTEPADVRSDVYALGCCAYELLTGRRIVPEGSAIAKLNAHVDGVTVTWDEDTTLPYALRRLVERCLAPTTDGRPPNMYVLDALLLRVEQMLVRQASCPEPLPSFTPCDVSIAVHMPITAANDSPTELGLRSLDYAAPQR